MYKEASQKLLFTFPGASNLLFNPLAGNAPYFSIYFVQRQKILLVSGRVLPVNGLTNLSANVSC
jgi:hypothetical protein